MGEIDLGFDALSCFRKAGQFQRRADLLKLKGKEASAMADAIAQEDVARSKLKLGQLT